MPTTLESFLIDLGWDIQGEKATTESDKILERIRGQSERAAEGVAAAFKRAAALATGAIAGIGAAGAAAVARYVELGSEVGETAQKLGLTARELQRLQQIQRATGGSTDALKDALKTMTVGFQEAATKGSGPFWEGLKLVGVELEELEGLNTEQQIGLLADALNEIKDPADRTASALKLFGEAGGLELQGLLARGSVGIRELGDEAERLGLVMDDRAVAGARRLKASLGQLEAIAGSVVGRVGEQLAPALQDAATDALEWVDANEQFIQQDLPAAISDVVRGLGELVAWLVDVQREMRQFGREVGYAYDEAAELAGAVADIASAIADELQPAIDLALIPLNAAADVFLAIQGAVVDAVTAIADMVGVLDDVRAAYNRLPFAGGDTPDADTRQGDFGRGPAAFLGGASSQASMDAELERQRAERAAALVPNAISAGLLAKAAAESLVAEGNARSATSGQRGRARAAGRAALAPGGGGGGGGGGKAANPAAKGGILDKLGLGGLFDQQPTFGEGLAGLLGLGMTDHAPAGGGSSPLAGATFATQTVNTTATVTIELPPGAFEGLSHREQADAVADAVRRALDDANRRALDYVQTPMRRG